MIKLINVNKYYQSGNDRIHVIKDLNYEFPNTGLVFILGPSGSGKSTLLNLLGGLDKPDNGEIWIENRELSTFSKTEQTNYLNNYLGFVFQEYNILKDLNLRQNISLSLQIQKVKKKVRKQKVSQIIEEVELTGLEKRKVSQLSGGQKQRIAIARALVKDPSLIIADEPTGNLDSETSKKIFDLFKKLSKKRLIIIVTHDEESATLYGDKILRIDTANLDTEDTVSNNKINASSNDELYFDRKLVLEKAKTPYKTIFKLSFKNIWIKKFRYLLMFVISLISLVFLSFAIELNGDKLYQNVYTTVNNNVNYADIYQYIPKDNIDLSKDYYAKYEHSPLMDNAYSVIKQIDKDLILHKYQPVNINYAKYNIERANFLYKGIIDTMIYYDNTNTYKLLAGKLPNPEEPEILITDYLVEAFKYFGIVDSSSNMYNIINKYFDFGYDINFKVVGIVETNFNKWTHLSRYKRADVFDEYDKSMQGFDYDYLMMNSFIVGSKYYNYILTNSSDITKISIDGYTLTNSKIITPEEHDNSLLYTYTKYNYTGTVQYTLYSEEPSLNNEIVIPKNLAKSVFGLPEITSDTLNNIMAHSIWYGKEVSVQGQIGSSSIDGSTYNKSVVKNFTIVGYTNSNNFVMTESAYKDFLENIEANKLSSETENIIVELSNNPNDVLNKFNKLYNNDYHFVIDIFNYKDAIESYNIDPMIEFASKGGLIVFTILTMGILWTIISIEIVDSKKEIGILRSIGLNGKKVSLIFIIQALFVNLLAYIASIPIANYVINAYGSNIKDSLGEISLSLYTLTYRSPVILFIFILLITIISTIVPLFNIMRKKIINVINERDN